LVSQLLGRSLAGSYTARPTTRTARCSAKKTTAANWNKWYDHYTPIADDLYDTHLDELRQEGLT